MDKHAVKLAPSILAADFAHLGTQVGEAEQAGADRLHIDVMDGRFVPNIALGVPIVESLRRITRVPLEIHLMISDPDVFLDAFTEAGADAFLVHWEGNNHLAPCNASTRWANAPAWPSTRPPRRQCSQKFSTTWIRSSS